MDHIDIIKSKLLLSDIVGTKVKLVRRGDNFVGLCPFHHEKTPSFSVSNSKGLYYCFGCSAYGDVFEFISKIEGLSFKETLERLALSAGVELPRNSSFAKENNNSACNLAVDWFMQKLHQHQNAIDYLKQRGVLPETINKFKIGYAPSFGLKEHLNSWDIDNKTLVEVGLIKKNLCDYFYERIMFPIYSVTGKIIAFGGRTLNIKHQPKYLNSPESQLFRKKENLYGLNLCLGQIRKEQHVFIVEGYMDVIALHQAGISNTVAPLGTALSLEQIKNLWKYVKEIYICMDGDSAGCKASIRVAELVLSILEPGYTLKFIILPSNKDPYDICHELQHNKDDILTVFNRLTKLHSEYLWYYINASQNYNGFVPEKYATLEHKFMQYVSAIHNNNMKKYYKDYFYSQLRKLRNTSKKYIFSRNNEQEKKEYLCNKSPELVEVEQSQIIVLRIIIEFPEFLSYPTPFEQFSHFEFTDQNIKELQQYIIDIINDEISLDKTTLLHTLEGQPKICKAVKYVLEKTNILNSQLSKKSSADSMWNNIMMLKELNSLREERYKARLDGNFDLEEILMERIKQLEENIREMQMQFIQKKTI